MQATSLCNAQSPYILRSDQPTFIYHNNSNVNRSTAAEVGLGHQGQVHLGIDLCLRFHWRQSPYKLVIGAGFINHDNSSVMDAHPRVSRQQANSFVSTNIRLTGQQHRLFPPNMIQCWFSPWSTHRRKCCVLIWKLNNILVYSWIDKTNILAKLFDPKTKYCQYFMRGAQLHNCTYI